MIDQRYETFYSAPFGVGLLVIVLLAYAWYVSKKGEGEDE